VTKVFVYGSLKQGYGNHPILGTSELVAQYVTEPKYTMYSLGAFPAVVLDGETAISGEVYDVNDSVFKALDRLEGYPTFYNRTQIDTPYGKAWMYYLESDNLYGNQQVTGGEW
jgi:gamma-glutamylcyclotransferase (GGCT)/AIG2-like uncharacterized protein YtfP